MAFDWQAFATGFLQQTATNQQEAAKDARDYEERQRNLAERNAVSISKRNSIANEVISISNMLRDNGASQQVIQAAISAGPKAIADLGNKVNQARELYGRKLGEDDIEALINMPEGFSVIDMNTEDFIKKTYGLGYAGKGVAKDSPERTFMDRLTGRKAREMAQFKLDSEVMQDGYTAYDINQMAQQQDYESLVPGTFITFNDVKFFNPSTDMAPFTRTFTNLVSDLEDSSNYKNLVNEIKQAEMDTSLTDEEKAIKKAKAEKELDELYLRNVGPTVDSFVSQYGDTFVDAADGFLRNYLSDSYVDSLSSSIDEEEDDTTIDSAIAEKEIDLKSEKILRSLYDTMETIERDADGVPIKAVSNNGQIFTPESLGWEEFLQADRLMNPVSEVGPEEKRQMEKLDLRGNVDFTAPKVTDSAPKVTDTVPEVDQTQRILDLEPPKQDREVEDKVETAEEMGIRKAANFMDRDRITFEEWQEMGPNARKLLGLPTSKVGAQNATANGFIEMPKGKVKRETIAARMAELEPDNTIIERVQDKIKRKFGVTQEQINKGIDTGSITELDLQVLDSYGDDIFEYMQQEGLDKDSDRMDIMQALTGWGDINNKVLPYNLGFLTIQFQKAFNK
tara:strand:- start:3478 stop:5343 length:1866 start_codon:yes stop_codon:yes gene_type:complete